MTDELNTQDVPTRATGLEGHFVDDQFVIYEVKTDRVHFLNASAALILEFCNGKRSVAEIVALVGEAYSLADAPVGEVHAGLKSLIAEGLIYV